MVDATSQLGRIEYEAPSGGPDTRLALPSGRFVWIEATFLQDRRLETPVGMRAEIQRHAVYRKLRRKRQQHNVEGPRLVCIGGRHSPALSSLTARASIGATQAMFAALRTTGAISGALVVDLSRKRAIASAYKNERSRSPLTEREWDHLLRLDFNRWSYVMRSLDDQERQPAARLKQNSGVISAKLPFSGGNMKVTIPGPMLLEALIQDKSLAKVYRSRPDDPIPHLLAKGWRLVGCTFIAASLEDGKSSAVELELAPAHDPVYWPTDTERGDI